MNPKQLQVSNTDSTGPLRQRNLEALLRPRSIAMIGASNDPKRGNGRTLRYLVEGGFQGPVYPVNPHRAQVQGLPACASARELPRGVDTAIVAVPATAAVQAVEECAQAGVRSVTVFASGFAEAGEEGRQLQARVTEIARASGMLVLGPNSLGLFDARSRAFMTFSSMFDDGFPQPGHIGMVTQSGGYGSQVYKLAAARGLPIVQWVSCGNECDVSAPELIAAMAHDPGIEVVLCYFEGVRNGRALLEAFSQARQAGKTVIVIKAGRTEAGSRAAASHTASLAGEDLVYDEVFRSLGIHRADSVEEMLDVAYAATRGRRPQGGRLVLLSPSGGFAVQMTDHAVQAGLTLPPVGGPQQARIRELMPNASPVNPVDLTGQILNELPIFGQVLDLLLEGDDYDGAALFVGMAGGAPSLADAWADALVAAAARHPRKSLLLSIVTSAAHVRRYEAAGFAVFEDTARMLRAHAAWVRAASAPAAARARVPAAEADWATLDPGQCRNEADAKALLHRIGIPTLEEQRCADAQAAARAAAQMGFPVAVKVLSADLPHKTEVGGVVLGLNGSEEVLAAVAGIAARVAAARPDARIEGYLVSPMATQGVECLVGVRHDPTFGPVVLFGAGGVLAELVADRALRLAPVDEQEALAMVEQTRIARLLRGYRNRPAYDLAALAQAVSRLSRFAAARRDAPFSVEINPLLVRAAGLGVVALDALVAAS
ncbi:MAG: hypothetical protein RI988_3301 [Pseudomonadota bacterium]|jgi:acyl-CoA synthetase (NDP forming)